eukprot:TRINITY_DN78_c0_g2_i1.p1 TRINITY_DN78_c0_g2~~TRINITY_DN78_c0_g2_i1.p1  ORF type:complete len:375 (+),score=169.38 TRINITY_DN78_c0_g2_i1:590-1714(+)
MSSSSSNEVVTKTLIMNGLTKDIKEREIRNMFRFFPGFIAAVIMEKKKKEEVENALSTLQQASSFLQSVIAPTSSSSSTASTPSSSSSLSATPSSSESSLSSTSSSSSASAASDSSASSSSSTSASSSSSSSSTPPPSEVIQKLQSATQQLQSQSSDSSCFVLFTNEDSAKDAKAALDGTRFDYHDAKSATIRLTYAPMNLQLPASYSSNDTSRLNIAWPPPSQTPASSSSSSSSPYPSSSSSYRSERSERSERSDRSDRSDRSERPERSSRPPKRSRFQDDTPTCSTLYISNMSEQASDGELEQIFSRCPGFVDMSVVHKEHRTFAWVAFDTIYSAQQVKSALQGFQLKSAPVIGGMTIQFSRNPLMTKRTRS